METFWNTMWGKMLEKQGFTIVILIAGIFFLNRDRDRVIAESAESRKKVDTLYRIMLHDKDDVIGKNTEALNNTSRVVRIYFQGIGDKATVSEQP